MFDDPFGGGVGLIDLGFDIEATRVLPGSSIARTSRSQPPLSASLLSART